MLKNLKMLHKVFVLSSVLLLFVFIVGFSGYKITQSVFENLHQMHSKDFKTINTLNGIRIQARTNQSNIFALIILRGDLEKQESYLGSIDKKVAGIYGDLDKLKQLELSKEEVEGIALIENAMPKYEEIIVKLKEMAASPDTKEEDMFTYYMQEDNQEIFKTIQTGSNGLIDDAVKLTDEAYASSEKYYNGASVMLLIMLVASIILGLAVTLYIVLPITKSLKSATNYLDVMATGDFSEEISPKLLKGKDETSDILRALNKMQKSVRKVIQSVVDETASIEQMVNISNEKLSSLNYQIEDVSATTQHLLSGMEETAASTEEMNATTVEIENAVEEIAIKAKNSALSSNEISSRAQTIKANAINSQKNTEQVYSSTSEKLRQAIEKSKSVNKIKELSEAILQITSQTNLLALNAAIEAARAGEAGKGFAVVADEIRKLADDSEKTVNEIQNVTQDVLYSVENLSESSEEILEFIDKQVVIDYQAMVDSGEKYSKDAEGVYNLSTDFSQSTQHIGVAVKNMIRAIGEIAQSTAEGSEGTSSIATKTIDVASMANEIMNQSTNIKSSTDRLSHNVAKFKI